MARTPISEPTFQAVEAAFMCLLAIDSNYFSYLVSHTPRSGAGMWPAEYGTDPGLTECTVELVDRSICLLERAAELMNDERLPEVG